MAWNNIFTVATILIITYFSLIFSLVGIYYHCTLAVVKNHEYNFYAYTIYNYKLINIYFNKYSVHALKNNKNDVIRDSNIVYQNKIDNIIYNIIILKFKFTLNYNVLIKSRRARFTLTLSKKNIQYSKNNVIKYCWKELLNTKLYYQHVYFIITHCKVPTCLIE